VAALLQWPLVIPAVREHLEAVIAELDKHLAELEAEIAQVLSIKGIGVATTAWLLVGTQNFQACASAASASAYVGLVPLEHESGSSVHGRAQIGHGGNGRLWTALYLATLTAARFNPVIKAHEQRLRAAGKPNKVARCAAARKLLHLAWAVVTKRQPFDPTYGLRLLEERQAA
jgi:transposase